MPVYIYEADAGEKGCTSCREPGFEVTQSMKDDLLKKCPTCKGKIHRVILPAQIQGSKYTGKGPSDKKLADHGFAKMAKQSDGTYKKIN